MICLFHDLLNVISFPHLKLVLEGCVHAGIIEDLLRVKCWLSNYKNCSTFETVLYSRYSFNVM